MASTSTKLFWVGLSQYSWFSTLVVVCCSASQMSSSTRATQWKSAIHLRSFRNSMKLSICLQWTRPWQDVSSQATNKLYQTLKTQRCTSESSSTTSRFMRIAMRLISRGCQQWDAKTCMLLCSIQIPRLQMNLKHRIGYAQMWPTSRSCATQVCTRQAMDRALIWWSTHAKKLKP